MGEIKILDTLVEVSGDAASDAGSTPAASTRARSSPGGRAHQDPPPCPPRAPQGGGRFAGGVCLRYLNFAPNRLIHRGLLPQR